MKNDSVRVYHLAKKYGMPSKRLIKEIKALGIGVESHMCILHEENIARLDALFLKKDEKGAKTVSGTQRTGQQKTSNMPKTQKTEQQKTTNRPKTQKTEQQKTTNRPKTQKTEQQKTTNRPKPQRFAHAQKKSETNKPAEPAVEEKVTSIELSNAITVKEFSDAIKQKTNEVQKALIMLGHMVPVNQVINLDMAQKVGKVFEVEVTEAKKKEKEKGEAKEATAEENARKVLRAPVVTIMGHVDHGKTSLLDKIRKTKVTDGEAGGITQHIGAYNVSTPGGKIVFLDTPGHEAFTAMRSRGVSVTDVVVLVVAADDGVKPQTIEALNHAKDAGVPIIVAVNKIDKPDADRERPRRELTSFELVPEEWGGETIFVDVSAITGEGIADLLEMILLQTELMELKADPNGPAEGIVIESSLDKKRGPIFTVLIQKGKLEIGSPFVCGPTYGKVKAMFNDKGKKIKKTGPSTPVEVLGISEVPMVGEKFNTVKNEREARLIAEDRQSNQRESYLSMPGRVSLQSLHTSIEDGKLKELKVVVKGDVLGSVQALCETLGKLPFDKVVLKVIHSSVGAITETDVLLAAAANALILGFNVRPETKASALAESEKVEIRMYSVIYDLVNDIRQAMVGMLDPTYTEKNIGRAEVREVFSIPKGGKIAGSMVIDGKITRSCSFRLIRDNIVIFSGTIGSLRRFKEDIKEVSSGYECGIGLEGYNDIKAGDIVETFVLEENKPETI